MDEGMWQKGHNGPSARMDVQAALCVSFSVLNHSTPGSQGTRPPFTGSGTQQRCGAHLHTCAPARSALPPPRPVLRPPHPVDGA